jgi:hypothetical protein
MPGKLLGVAASFRSPLSLGINFILPAVLLSKTVVFILIELFEKTMIERDFIMANHMSRFDTFKLTRPTIRFCTMRQFHHRFTTVRPTNSRTRKMRTAFSR